ncbi:MAG: hypothetical protein WCG08_13935 [Paludibacter sp.]
MKNLDLNNCGVIEMNTKEMIDFTGGTLAAFIDGINAGTGAVKINQDRYGSGFWYTVGYGIGLTVKQGVA